jgi:hypothetical protein
MVSGLAVWRPRSTNIYPPGLSGWPNDQVAQLPPWIHGTLTPSWSGLRHGVDLFSNIWPRGPGLILGNCTADPCTMTDCETNWLAFICTIWGAIVYHWIIAPPHDE